MVVRYVTAHEYTGPCVCICVGGLCVHLHFWALLWVCLYVCLCAGISRCMFTPVSGHVCIVLHACACMTMGGGPFDNGRNSYIRHLPPQWEDLGVG